MPAVPRHGLASRGEAVSRGYSDERDRGHDSRLDLGSQRSRARPQHLRERGASAAGEIDDNRKHRHQQRSRAGADTDRACGLCRDRHRGRRRQRERHPAEPRNREPALRQRSSRRRGSSSSIRASPPGHPGARAGTAPWNVVTGSGWADLALAKGAGKGNCFTANVARRSLPRRPSDSTCRRVGGDGDASVAAELTRPVRVMFDQTLRRRNPPEYTSMPVPPPQPTMPVGG